VICAAKIAETACGTAWERFTPAGPLALLPRRDAHAVVFTASTAAAAHLSKLEDEPFLAALQEQFGERLRFVWAGPRSAFPLVLRVRASPVGERAVFLGNAAQTLHPVAGQGYNLALRDVWSLAELLRERGGEDPGAPALLRRYAARRQLDRAGVVGFTDGLIRLFANDNPVLKLARGGGLALLDALPPARDFVARRMMFGARAWP
jgi:2-octaprenyl-6-methoxyphenol hydroxylase